MSSRQLVKTMASPLVERKYERICIIRFTPITADKPDVAANSEPKMSGFGPLHISACLGEIPCEHGGETGNAAASRVAFQSFKVDGAQMGLVIIMLTVRIKVVHNLAARNHLLVAT